MIRTHCLKATLALIPLAFVLTACASDSKPIPPSSLPAPSDQTYNYPIKNRYAATIIGTPAELKSDYSAVPQPVEKTLTVFKDRKIPEGFWYEKGLRYGELLQKGPAPLIFVMAGTGADHRSEKMRDLGNIFYTAGFHVILLPSTTHSNFIVTASENFIPGNPREAAKDMYRVIELINRDLAKQEVKANGYYLTGYSLGAMDAAFTAELDSRVKTFDFKKTLLIDPPVNLYNSIKTIDAMLYEGLPEGIDGVDRFIDTELSRLSTLSQSGDALDFQNTRLFVEAYSKYPPSDKKLATMIGLTFRLFAANMIFTSDVMAHTGYIFPKDVKFRTSTSLNNYMSVALRTSLVNYFDDVYSQYYSGSMTRDQLVASSSLEALSGFISNNPKIGVIANEDDVILAPGDIQKLRSLFGTNATIYPNGGHLGNIAYPPVAGRIVQFITEGSAQ